jgi:hypothetical protein
MRGGNRARYGHLMADLTVPMSTLPRQEINNLHDRPVIFLLPVFRGRAKIGENRRL